MDDAILGTVLDEVDAPALQSRIRRLASTAAEANQHLAEARTLVVAAGLTGIRRRARRRRGAACAPGSRTGKLGSLSGKTEVQVRWMLICSRAVDPHLCPVQASNPTHTMFYALSWFVIVALLALWSLAAWALHAVAVWTVSSAGALSGAASGFGGIAVPAWLAPWVPSDLVHAMAQLMAGLGPMVDSLLTAAPALAGGLTVLAWVVWAIGGVLLLVLGAGLHLLIAMWRRRGGNGAGPGAGPSFAPG